MDVFRSEELRPPELKRKGTATSNVCGEQHGFSTTRRRGRTNDQLLEQADDYANEKPDRHSLGILIAKVGSLREIRKTGDPITQVVYVYDDPAEDDNNHAVVRVDVENRPDFQDVRDKVIKAFATSVPPKE